MSEFKDGVIIFRYNNPADRQFEEEISAKGYFTVANNPEVLREGDARLARLVVVPNEVLSESRFGLVEAIHKSGLFVAVISVVDREVIGMRAQSLQIKDGALQKYIPCFWRQHPEKVVNWLGKTADVRRGLL